ncbi:MAG: HAMP domain-containing protein, partial [Myxococcota bacterium]|nr:HAMP domain-containing protein [Myxococcota bacterium]
MADEPVKPNTPVERLRVWQRFHVRLTFAYAVTVLLAIGSMGVLYYQQSVQGEFETLQHKLSANTISLAELLGPVLSRELDPAGSVSTQTLERLREHLSTIGRSDGDIASLYIFVPTDQERQLRFVIDWTRDERAARPGQLYDATNSGRMMEGFEHPLVENQLYYDEWGWSLSGYAPVLDRRGKTIAIVGADILAPRIDSIKRRVLWESTLVFGITAVLLTVIAWFVGRNVRRPLSSIIEATTAIASGNLQARSKLLRDDEFGIIGRHFDNMAKGLEEREMIRDALGRYISPDVAAQVLADPEGPKLGGEERVVTVLFSDLRGYSTISERLGPTDVVRLMNLYLGAMQEVLDEHQGV